MELKLRIEARQDERGDPGLVLIVDGSGEREFFPYSAEMTLGELFRWVKGTDTGQ